MFVYKLISSQILFDHPYAKVILDTLEHDGIELPYFYLTSPVDAVATVGLLIKAALSSPASIGILSNRLSTIFPQAI